MLNKIKIIVVDDHELFRIGVSSVLEIDASLKVIAEASTANALLEMLSDGMKPDIVLLDIIMPGISGPEAAKQIRTCYPDIKILMLTSENSNQVLTECINSGVNGFLSKLDASTDLLKAIHAVYNGEYFYGKVICKIMYEVLLAENIIGGTKKLPDFTDRFSQRELDIISCCAEGMSSKETAEKLFISKRTVDWHRSNIFSKLGIHSQLELVKYAVKKGIVKI